MTFEVIMAGKGERCGILGYDTVWSNKQVPSFRIHSLHTQYINVLSNGVYVEQRGSVFLQESDNILRCQNMHST
jgi:hypothetical protein